MAWIYLTIEQAIEIHAKTIEISGGGAVGAIDIGRMESVLQNIQNDDYYPTFEKKTDASVFQCLQVPLLYGRQ